MKNGIVAGIGVMIISTAMCLVIVVPCSVILWIAKPRYPDAFIVFVAAMISFYFFERRLRKDFGFLQDPYITICMLLVAAWSFLYGLRTGLLTLFAISAAAILGVIVSIFRPDIP